MGLPIQKVCGVTITYCSEKITLVFDKKNTLTALVIFIVLAFQQQHSFLRIKHSNTLLDLSVELSEEIAFVKYTDCFYKIFNRIRHLDGEISMEIQPSDDDAFYSLRAIMIYHTDNTDYGQVYDAYCKEWGHS